MRLPGGVWCRGTVRKIGARPTVPSPRGKCPDVGDVARMWHNRMRDDTPRLRCLETADVGTEPVEEARAGPLRFPPVFRGSSTTAPKHTIE